MSHHGLEFGENGSFFDIILLVKILINQPTFPLNMSIYEKVILF